jgi:catechol 2,3-dioxygenase-like lactoylglutathione lyase family enzyme
MAPRLDGIHHVKLPVRDLARSRAWYESRLGYQTEAEFVEQGKLMGIAMRHPNGGPEFALRLDPARAEAAAGFDYFAIGVPSKEAMEDLAARLTSLGEQHAGVHYATIGWILPLLHDPDGHEVRFYTTVHHSEPPSEGVMRVEDPRERAEAIEAAQAAGAAQAARVAAG